MENVCYKQGDFVKVCNLGPSFPGEFLAEVIGVFGDGFYIVRWYEHPVGIEKWEASVIIQGCMEKATPEFVLAHYTTWLEDHIN